MSTDVSILQEGRSGTDRRPSRLVGVIFANHMKGTTVMAEPLVWTETESDNVKRVAFDDETQTLCVEFHNGGLYTYSDVGEDIYVALVHAPSVGRYLNMVVKGMYLYEKHSSVLDLETNLASK